MRAKQQKPATCVDIKSAVMVHCGWCCAAGGGLLVVGCAMVVGNSSWLPHAACAKIKSAVMLVVVVGGASLVVVVVLGGGYLVVVGCIASPMYRSRFTARAFLYTFARARLVVTLGSRFRVRACKFKARTSLSSPPWFTTRRSMREPVTIRSSYVAVAAMDMTCASARAGNRHTRPTPCPTMQRAADAIPEYFVLARSTLVLQHLDADSGMWV